ncbi:muskelin 1 isoform X2 [Brevipalpus obovatus]|uniref:muskelin 1 isoform X2 n=1 Tax=Brevipalpus obovatus TaxID=246614 RepID=UPI003D9E7EAD
MSNVGDQFLKYSIHKYSSYTPPHVPENILCDEPHDQSSRWSSESNNPPQFLILKLDYPAIIKEITFGKFQKHHICDMKKFNVFGGMSENNMIELCNSGLKCDNAAETFILKHSTNNHQFPCRYIKIMPIQSWGPSYNFSIWYVKLKGNNDPIQVKDALNKFYEYREKLAICLCLKHFRQYHYTEAFEALQRKTKVSLEHPLLSELHEALVVRGDFVASEDLIKESMEKGLLMDYLEKQSYSPKWTQIIPAPDTPKPGIRSGHQMCVDPQTETIYLFGGWDGSKDLADLWSFNIQTNTWTCLNQNTASEGGPSARSCHRMCLDHKRKKLFVLGRFADLSNEKSLLDISLKSDFYVYDTESNKWQIIMDDTASMGGPRLLQHYQMAMDIEKNTIYVFGGKITRRQEREKLSGLYSYHVPTNTWTLLREDISSSKNDVPKIRSRANHSMLFHWESRQLYIFGGRRGKENVDDMLTYNVDTDELKRLRDDNQEMPASEYTHTATIDVELNEIHVLYGINRERERRSEALKNSLWVYSIKEMKWSCICRREDSSSNHSEPCPRYAMQLVYDHVHRIHYVFGGNSCRNHVLNSRLNDFWSLKLCKLGEADLLRNCQKLIREYCFREKIMDDPVDAVRYLRNELSEAFDHSDPNERIELGLLAASLFKSQEKDFEYYPNFDDSKRFFIRSRVFDSLAQYFPEDMTQPKDDLINLIQLNM